MELKFYPNPILREPTKEIVTVDEDVKSLIANLYSIMRKYRGFGLAAPQIGVSKKVAVVEVDNKSYTLINPVVVDQWNLTISSEGCLSFPSIMINHVRPTGIKVKSLDLEGKEVEYTVEGMLAKAFSHEIDHLNNILFVDELSSIKKDVIRRKIIKLERKYNLI